MNENEWAKLVSLQPAKLTLTSRKGDFHSGLVSPMKKASFSLLHKVPGSFRCFLSFHSLIYLSRLSFALSKLNR